MGDSAQYQMGVSPEQDRLARMSKLFGNDGVISNLFNQSSPELQQVAPYQYANTSLASLFQSINKSGGNSALTGLLSGSQGASSGAGRFMSGAPMNDFMGGFVPQANYVSSYTPSPFVMPTQDINQIVAQTTARDNSPTGNMSMVNGGYGWGANLGK